MCMNLKGQKQWSMVHYDQLCRNLGMNFVRISVYSGSCCSFPYLWPLLDVGAIMEMMSFWILASVFEYQPGNMCKCIVGRMSIYRVGEIYRCQYIELQMDTGSVYNGVS
jgi:hypothetical protein